MRFIRLAAFAAAAMLPANVTAAREAQAPAIAPAARDAAAVVDRFHQALRAGDLSAAASFLDDHALIYESGGVERSKAEYQAHHLPADSAFSQAVPTIVLKRRGEAVGDLAWVASEGRMKGSFNASPVDRLSTETMLLRRNNGAWKIVHIHWSSGAAPRP